MKFSMHGKKINITTDRHVLQPVEMRVDFLLTRFMGCSRRSYPKINSSKPSRKAGYALYAGEILLLQIDL